MNDTNINMDLLQYFAKATPLSSSDVLNLVDEEISLVTVKRQLSTLTKADYLEQVGAGRSTKYLLNKKGQLLRPIDTDEYLAVALDNRSINPRFQFDVFEQPNIDLFSGEELKLLNEATEKYRANAIGADPTVRKKELMRFIVEFSWKSSEIEGNTYDLISTERLLMYGEKSTANTEYESQMIINQKDALEFILQNEEIWKQPRISSLEALHSYVAHKLDISNNIRESIVGITGTNYRPLENEFQIRDALELLLQRITESDNTYEKALLAVLGLRYIQPFVDGNKRTSRLLGDAILLTDNYAPLSYRSVNNKTYKEACLVFYEQNSIEPFKKIFIEQYVFAANNYNIAKES